jgi:drug/metabolite transporter (DMT)-like permease
MAAPQSDRGSAISLAAFLLLCLLWSLDSLRSDLFPQFAASHVPPLLRETVALSLLTFVAALFTLVRSKPWPRGKQLGLAAAIGLGLFAAPAVLLSLADPFVSGATRVAIFSLVPLIAVVLEPYLVGESNDPSATNPKLADIARPAKGGLLGALVAIAGTLLVFPVHLAGSSEAIASSFAVLIAAASVAVTNCAAVRHVRSLHAQSIAPTMAVAAAAAALTLAIAGAFSRQAMPPSTALLRQLALAAAIDLPGLLLLFWLMRRMSAARMTTRFQLAPLITIVIALAIEPAAVGLRGFLGLLLIAAGAGWLLFAPGQEPESGSSPLRLYRGS